MRRKRFQTILVIQEAQFVIYFLSDCSNRKMCGTQLVSWSRRCQWRIARAIFSALCKIWESQLPFGSANVRFSSCLYRNVLSRFFFPPVSFISIAYGFILIWLVLMVIHDFWMLSNVLLWCHSVRVNRKYAWKKKVLKLTFAKSQVFRFVDEFEGTTMTSLVAATFLLGAIFAIRVNGITTKNLPNSILNNSSDSSQFVQVFIWNYLFVILCWRTEKSEFIN